MRNANLKITRVKKSSDISEAFKKNDNDFLKSLYATNYHKVEALVLKNSGTKEHAKDIYHDAFIATWRNIRNDSFIPKSLSSLNGYLYTVAKNKWMDILRSKKYKKTVYNDNLQIVNGNKSALYVNLETNEFETKLDIAIQAFKNLGEPCKSLLQKFYFEKKSMKDLAVVLNLTEASARNKKYRCMQKLRELAQNLKHDL